MTRRASIANWSFHISFPYQLRIDDFRLALTDVYDFFYDVNEHLTARGLQRLDDMLRPAIMSGVLSDMLTSSLARHSRTLVENRISTGIPTWWFRGCILAIQSKRVSRELKSRRRATGAER